MQTVAEHLKAASKALKQKKPGMSLRAVAARLEVSPSYWSKVLRGERSVTQKLLPRVVKVFGMDTQQVAELQRLIIKEIEDQEFAPATGLHTASPVASPVEGYRALGESDFWLLEEWYYIPVLNAVTLKGRPAATEIARRLNIDLAQARRSLEKLIAAGFVRAAGEGFERTDLQVRFPTNRSHPQVRAYHAHMLERAGTELKTPEGYVDRLVSSVCFAGSKAQLSEARLILEEAMFRAANLLAEPAECEEIFQLNVQLFPLTK